MKLHHGKKLLTQAEIWGIIGSYLPSVRIDGVRYYDLAPHGTYVWFKKLLEKLESEDRPET